MNPVLREDAHGPIGQTISKCRLYHDTEWGVPVHNDTKLFEFMVLECAQAGLSWSIILRKRLDYRKAFVNYDVKRVAEFGMSHVEKLLKSTNISIVRNRLKVNSAVTNARAFIKIQHDFGSLIIMFGTLLKAEEPNTIFLRIADKFLVGLQNHII